MVHEIKNGQYVLACGRFVCIVIGQDEAHDMYTVKDVDDDYEFIVTSADLEVY